MALSALQTRLRLARVQTMALTALVPVLGAMVYLGESAGGGVEGWNLLVDLVLLFLAGAMFHVFGFVLNEWADVEVDRASEDLSGKPLVSGAVSREEALGVAVVAALLSLVLMALVTLDPLPHLMLALAILVGGAYDLWGKRMPLDALLAGSLTLLLFAGALASDSFDWGSSRHWTLFACIGGLQFLQNLFQNAVEGGIKDVDHDAAAGARTFAVVLGVRVEDGRLVLGRGFPASAVAMKTLHLALLGYTALFTVGLEPTWDDAPQLALLLLSASVMAGTLPMFLRERAIDRSRLKRAFSVHEMATFLGTVVVFSPIFGVMPSLVVFLLPFLWFLISNVLLFQRALEPGV